MNDRLENLFSPDKLKKRWEKKSTSGRPSIAQWKARMEKTPIQDELSGVSKEILSAVKGEKRQKVLTMLLDDIKKKMERLDSSKQEDISQEAEIFALIDQIQQMEDLIEAYLGDQRDL
jgi:hypothetical protein